MSDEQLNAIEERSVECEYSYDVASFIAEVRRLREELESANKINPWNKGEKA